MPLIQRGAERFQRALDGERVTDEGLRQLLDDAEALVSVATRTVAADPEFVAALRDRLLTEASAWPARAPHRPRTATPQPVRPLILVIGRGVPRLAAGLAASVLAVGGILGAASQSALPGGALYPVRGWVDGAAVRLSGSDFDRGSTLLDQAKAHVDDARELSSRGEDDADLYVAALEAARTDVRAGRTSLHRAFEGSQDAQTLLETTDFVARVRPHVDAARREVPGAALPAVVALLSDLDELQRTSVQSLADCSPRCIDPATVQDLLGRVQAVDRRPVASGTGSTTSTTAPPSASSVGTPLARRPRSQPHRGGRPGGSSGSAGSNGSAGAKSSAGASSAGSNGPARSAPGAGPTPPVSIGSGGVVVGGSNGGATIGPDGVTVNGPTISVPVPSSTLALPTIGVGTGAGAGSGGITPSVPDQTLGGSSVPGLGLGGPPRR